MADDRRPPHRIEVHLEANSVSSKTGESEKADSRPLGRPADDEPFRILLMGDFGARGRGATDKPNPPLGRRRIHRIDRDDFDQVLGRIAPALQLRFTEDGEPISLAFEELDDFHPDRIAERVPILRSLLEVRRTLGEPQSPRGEPQQASKAAPRETPAPEPPRAPSGAGLLDQILGDSPEVVSTKSESGDLADFLSRAMEGHTVPALSDAQRGAIEQVDDAIGSAMRAILHHPDFQALEALWRGAYFLTRRIETSATLQIHVLDVSKTELADDLRATADVEDSESFTRLANSSASSSGEPAWNVIVGLFEFGTTAEDVGLIGRLASLARAAGTPVVSAARPELVGASDFSGDPDPRDWSGQLQPQWTALRGRPEAAFVGLVAPRLLLRMPYGKNTDPTELVSFEEMPNGPEHESYLWGNPALAVAHALARAFEADGWAMRPARHLDIESLPLHIVNVDGEAVATPSAEARLTERAADRMLDHGLMPLAWMKDSDRARLVRVQSIANPNAPLAGRWT